MIGLLKAIRDSLEKGQSDPRDVISGEVAGCEPTGYVKIKGMVEYFKEQEIFAFPEAGLASQQELPPFESVCNGPTRGGRKKIREFGSRNVYTFSSVPFETIGEWTLGSDEITYQEQFYNTYGGFKDCVAKFYDFTIEFPESSDSIEILSKDRFLQEPEDLLHSLSSSGVAGHDIMVNELLEIFSIVEFQDLEDTLENPFEVSYFQGNQNLVRSETKGPFRLVLHVFAFKKISNYSPVKCPAIRYDGFLGKFQSPLETCRFLDGLSKCENLKSETVSDIYEIMIEYISTKVCNGNYLLSEYILLCISNRQKLQQDVDEDDSINKLSSSPMVLHISMCSREFIGRLREFLTKHLPRLLWLNVDLSTLNDSKLTPYFDVEEDKFVTGALQVPLMRNLIVVDETTLEEGKLTEKGVENMSNIVSLVNSGIVKYGFPSYDIPIKSEANFIVLTSKMRSIFCKQSDISVRMDGQNSRVGNSGLGAARKVSHISEINISSNLIVYLSIVGSCVDMLEFDDKTREYIADSFARIRQRFNSENRIHPGILHMWMMMARTQALLNGEERLEKQRFEKFISLESERLGKETTIEKV
ncbi:Mini-chromosome maintenance complex-binding protein [Cryptosporidium felis]|nr:Mini-chromosome maintenance complex-binding protein [Cryptosporidium felis]